MDTLNGTTIFWLVAMGLTVGYMVKYIVKEEGIDMKFNIVFGIAGSLVLGVVGIVMEFWAPLLLAFAGTLGVLFLANVFHQHHVEDLQGHIDQGIQIKKK